jgi:hypothetical protein
VVDSLSLFKQGGSCEERAGAKSPDQRTALSSTNVALLAQEATTTRQRRGKLVHRCPDPLDATAKDSGRVTLP